MRKKLKGKMKKVISVLLCAVMMLGLMPDLSMTVYANEEGTYVQAEGNIATEAVDFSDAQVLTSVDGILYIDGVEAEQEGTNSIGLILPAGKYKLESDISTSYYSYIWQNEGDTINLDLNGYTWDMSSSNLLVNGAMSIYDTSDEETGKMISTTEVFYMNYEDSSVFNLYSGTVETTGTTYAVAGRGKVNLYGGKIKSSGDAIVYSLVLDTVINLDGTLLECGEGYAHFKTNMGDRENKAVIDVTDYTGDSLRVQVNALDVGATSANIKIFEGIKNAEEAEKYTIDFSSEYYECCLEKTEYDETTGEKYIYVVKNAFTQQPSVDNNYTVDFNNPAATFQWYELEETVLTDENVVVGENIGYGVKFENGKWIVSSGFVSVFSYEAKAGDKLKVSTNSDMECVGIGIGSASIELRQNYKSRIVNIDSDTTLDIRITIMQAESPVELEFSIINETAVNGETGKTLQSTEHKSYQCKATVGTRNYYSDKVVRHTPVYSANENSIIVTCSLCSTVLGRITLNAPAALTYDGSAKEAIMDGVIAGVDASNIVYKKGDEILTGAPVDEGAYEASITLGEATASVTFEVFKADMEVTASGYIGTYDNASHSIKVNAPEGATVEYKYGADGEWSTTNPVFSNVGTYEVEYRVSKENYNIVTGKATVTINPADMEVTAIGYTGIYDKALHGITVNAPEGATIEYKYGADGEWSTTNPAFSNAGIYEVDYRVTKENYNIVTGKATVTINPADMEVTAIGYTGIYDKASHGITVNAPEGVTVEYKYGADGEWSTTNPVFSNAGIYEVDYRVTKENYNIVTGKATVTINPADMKVTASGYTGTYDKASHSIKVTALNGAKVEYRLSKNAKWSTKNPKFKDPSEKAITVYYRVTMANYKTVEGSAKVHVKFNLKKGATFPSGKYKYKITGTSTVAFTGITSSSMKKVTIPKTVKYGGKTFKVTAVATKALKGKTKVTDITIGSNVTSIGSSAFAGCTKLTTVKIGSKVKTIGKSAFEGCKKLSKVTMGSAVTTIDDKAFKNCIALKSITIPSKVTKVDTQAFYGCKSLKTITIKSTKLKTVGKNALKGINAKATIKVPSSKLKSYKNLLKNKGQGSKVKIVKSK